MTTKGIIKNKSFDRFSLYYIIFTILGSNNNILFVITFSSTFIKFKNFKKIVLMNLPNFTNYNDTFIMNTIYP